MNVLECFRTLWNINNIASATEALQQTNLRFPGGGAPPAGEPPPRLEPHQQIPAPLARTAPHQPPHPVPRQRPREIGRVAAHVPVRAARHPRPLLHLRVQRRGAARDPRAQRRLAPRPHRGKGAISRVARAARLRHRHNGRLHALHHPVSAEPAAPEPRVVSAHHRRRRRAADHQTREHRRESGQPGSERGEADHGAVAGTLGQVRAADAAGLPARGAGVDAGADQVRGEERARPAGQGYQAGRSADQQVVINRRVRQRGELLCV